MTARGRLGAVVGSRSVFGALGGLFLLVAAVRATVRWSAGAPTGSLLIVTTLIAAPGAGLVYGSVWLGRSDVDPAFYPDVVRWSFLGLGTMAGIILLYHVQPQGGVSSPWTSPPILVGLSTLAGFGVGVHDARAKGRALALERRNDELRETQAALEDTVGRLRESETRYRTLTENFPNGAVALLDEGLCHTLVDGQGFDRLSFDADDLRGERVADLYEDPVREVVESHYRRTLEGAATTFELDVEGRTFEFHTHPLTDDAGEVDGVLAMSQDVTERKERERELARRARQQAVVASLGQVALEGEDLDELLAEATRLVTHALDTDYCKVLDLDDAGEELLLRQGTGWRAGVVGDATVSAQASDSQAAYTLTADHPIVVEDLETEPRFSGPDLLTSHDVRSGISTVIGPNEDPWGVLGTHDTERRSFTEEDVNFVQSVATVLAAAIERRQYQSDLESLVEDLETSNERLEQFAYAASHDLQEPLRMVSSYLQLVERRYGDDLDEEGREFVGYAVDGADRMRAMIRGLLAYSRVETEGEPLQSVDLAAVVDDVLRDVGVAVERSEAQVTVGELPRVRGDPAQLRQVFQNLLENAIEYAGDSPPRVHVSAERDGGRWTIHVRDESVGIHPSDQDRVVEVFERAHPRTGKGSGIGLAVCERIVERHGGDLWIDSEPDGGTTVSFTLPTSSEQRTSPPSDAAS